MTPKLDIKPRKSRTAPALTNSSFNSCACTLDRLADAELQHGHIAAAELLARRAEQMREVVR
jgi:hypothetical protein